MQDIFGDNSALNKINQLTMVKKKKKKEREREYRGTRLFETAAITGCYDCSGFTTQFLNTVIDISQLAVNSW